MLILDKPIHQEFGFHGIDGVVSNKPFADTDQRIYLPILNSFAVKPSEDVHNNTPCLNPNVACQIVKPIAALHASNEARLYITICYGFSGFYMAASPGRKVNYTELHERDGKYVGCAA